MTKRPVESDMGTDWETYVQKTATAFIYPPTPDLSREQPVHVVRWRAAWIALVLLLVFGALLTVPEVRASVLKVLRIGGIQIMLDEPTAIPITVTPPVLSIPDAPQLTLAGETTLEAAQEEVNFTIRLPSALEPPDRVFLQDVGGPLVILVWTAPDDPSQIQISLHILGPGVSARKGEPELIQETEVNGQYALWLEGPHMLLYERVRPTGNGPMLMDVRQLVEGHILLWEEDWITYRLESDLSLEEAVQIAESLQGGQ